MCLTIPFLLKAQNKRSKIIEADTAKCNSFGWCHYNDIKIVISFFYTLPKFLYANKCKYDIYSYESLFLHKRKHILFLLDYSV